MKTDTHQMLHARSGRTTNSSGKNEKRRTPGSYASMHHALIHRHETLTKNSSSVVCGALPWSHARSRVDEMRGYYVVERVVTRRGIIVVVVVVRRENGLIVQTEDFRITGGAARSRPLLEAQLHAHLLPGIVGAHFRTGDRQMRFVGRWSGRRRHGLLGGGTGLRTRVVGQSQRGRLAARAQDRAAGRTLGM